MVHSNVRGRMRDEINAYCGRVHRNVCGKRGNRIDAYCGVVHRIVCGKIDEKLVMQKVAIQKAVSELSEFSVAPFPLMGGTSL